jgi:hypothetical protein
MDDYKYSLPTSTGGRLCVSPRDVDIEDDYDDNDSSGASYYLPDVDDADLDDAERVLDNKSMLRYT